MGTTWDRRQWQDADSLAAIGELTARWLEGTLAYQPEDFATEPAPETRPLVPVLAPLNRAGYVTTNSQPGATLRAGAGQRAFVTGYCDELSLRRLERAVGDTDLVLLAFRPDESGGEPVVVTMRDGGRRRGWGARRRLSPSAGRSTRTWRPLHGGVAGRQGLHRPGRGTLNSTKRRKGMHLQADGITRNALLVAPPGLSLSERTLC